MEKLETGSYGTATSIVSVICYYTSGFCRRNSAIDVVLTCKR